MRLHWGWLGYPVISAGLSWTPYGRGLSYNVRTTSLLSWPLMAGAKSGFHILSQARCADQGDVAYPKMCRRSGWGCSLRRWRGLKVSSECKPCLKGVFATFFAVKASCKQMLTCCWGLSIKDALLVCYPLEPSKKDPLLTVIVPGLLTMSSEYPRCELNSWQLWILSLLVNNRRQYLSGILWREVKER